MSQPNSKYTLLIDFFKRHLFVAVISFVSGLVFNLLTLLIPVAIGKFYELNFGFSSHKLRFFEKFSFFNVNDFDGFFSFFLILIALRLAFEFTNKYVIGLAGERFSKELREKLFEKQLLIPLPVYDDKGMGKYLLRFSGDLNSVRNYLTKGILRFWQDMTLLLILLGGIAFIDWKIMLIISTGFGGIMLLLLVLNRIVRSVSTQIRNRKSGLLSFVNVRLRAIASIIAFNKQSPENKRFGQRSDKIFMAGRSYQQITALIYALIPATTYLVIGVLMYYFYHFKQELGYGGLLALILIIISFLPTFRRVLRVGVIWQMGNISFGKLIRVFELAETEVESQKQSLEEVRSIELKELFFHYETISNSLLKNISARFEESGVYVIRGRNGSGKSTLAKVLLLLYKPSKGEILVNDQPVSNFNDFDVRKHMTAVSKDYPLYGSTVYESIVYARNKERKERAGKLLMKLQDHLPAKLKMSLDTKIGELGSKLTNSQMVLLMYCRAFLSNKKIIIIEDSFSEFNSKTRELIYGKLHKLGGSRLIILFTENAVKGMNVKKEFALRRGGLISA